MKKVVNVSNGAVIGTEIQTAFSFWPRFKGLLGKKTLAEGEGLLLHPCSSIHCFGMRFPIDVVFLNRDFIVISIKQKMKQGSFAACKGASYVLELSNGQINKKKIRIGDRLLIEDES